MYFHITEFAKTAERKKGVKLAIGFSNKKVINKLRDSSFGVVLNCNSVWCEVWSKMEVGV